jgi:hypothetical protein
MGPEDIVEIITVISTHEAVEQVSDVNGTKRVYILWYRTMKSRWFEMIKKPTTGRTTRRAPWIACAWDIHHSIEPIRLYLFLRETAVGLKHNNKFIYFNCAFSKLDNIKPDSHNTWRRRARRVFRFEVKVKLLLNTVGTAYLLREKSTLPSRQQKAD